MKTLPCSLLLLHEHQTFSFMIQDAIVCAVRAAMQGTMSCGFLRKRDWIAEVHNHIAAMVDVILGLIHSVSMLAKGLMLPRQLPDAD